jgi:hypothetical protein
MPLRDEAKPKAAVVQPNADQMILYIRSFGLIIVADEDTAMRSLVLEKPTPDVQAVALKAFSRIVQAWSLTLGEAAALADMSTSTWKRAKKPDFAGDLTWDQMLRLSALVGLYKSLELYFDPPLSREWVKLANRGPDFDGARPVDAMIAGGLPKILRVRAYVDALRGGM